LSVDPVTRKPGIMGLTSKDETESSWACNLHTALDTDFVDGARRPSKKCSTPDSVETWR